MHAYVWAIIHNHIQFDNLVEYIDVIQKKDGQKDNYKSPNCNNIGFMVG